jgi:hypothetical protein
MASIHFGGTEDMRVPAIVLTFIVASLVAVSPAMAQEGHPLKGSWLGNWGPSEDHTNSIIIVMDWDGEEITGVINPGTDDIPIQNASLNPDGWVVHLEATTQNRSGQTLNYVIEGTIEGLPFNSRSITGTWRHQNASGPFEITRQ